MSGSVRPRASQSGDKGGFDGSRFIRDRGPVTPPWIIFSLTIGRGIRGHPSKARDSFCERDLTTRKSLAYSSHNHLRVRKTSHALARPLVRRDRRAHPKASDSISSRRVEIASCSASLQASRRAIGQVFDKKVVAFRKSRGARGREILRKCLKRKVRERFSLAKPSSTVKVKAARTTTCTTQLRPDMRWR